MFREELSPTVVCSAVSASSALLDMFWWPGRRGSIESKEQSTQEKGLGAKQKSPKPSEIRETRSLLCNRVARAREFKIACLSAIVYEEVNINVLEDEVKGSGG
jgi:hypothetical protein